MTLISSLIPLRSHHPSVHAPHGRGGHPGRPHRHHLARQAALLRLLALPEEVLWQRLLPDAGAGRLREDDGPESRNHPHGRQGGTTKT